MHDDSRRSASIAQLRSSARWLDRLTLLFLVLGACVLVFGGFRERIAGLQLSVTSWERLFFITLLVTTLRHAYVRRPTLIDVVRERWRLLWSSEALAAVWPAFISTRTAVLVTGVLAVVTFGFAPGTERFRVSDNVIANLMARWDAAWYFGIVTEGYSWNGDRHVQQNVVFFPAFPLAVRIVGLLFGRDWLLTGLILASGAFLGALVYLYRLCRQYLDPERARWAVWALAAYPFAIYYSAPYTESFFLLGSAGAFYHATRKEWWRAGGWGFFLGLCRPNGFLIAVPFAILAAERAWKERKLPADAIAAIALPVLGLFSYCLFLEIQFGDPLAWRKGQLAWGRAYVGLWPSLRALWEEPYKIIAAEGLHYYFTTEPYKVMYLCSAVFVLGSVVPSIRRFGLAFGAFTAVNILPPLLIGGLMSIGRMSSVLFPAFMTLAAILPPRVMPQVVAWSLVLQGLIAALFFTWRPVF